MPRISRKGWYYETSAASITYEGVTRPQTFWAKRYGIPYSALNHRIKVGWPVEEALTTPVGQRRKR